MKHCSNTFLTAIIICGLILASFSLAGAVRGSTFTGVISSDTTWTKAHSPYNLTGTVTVDNGVTLTIEAGATVDLNGYSLQVNGILRAIGSSTDGIQFNSGKIVFSSSSAGWDEQSGSGSIIEKAIINQTEISSSNSLKVSKSSITAPDDASTGTLAIGGLSVISNNIIISTSGKGYGIIVKQGIANIYGNIISGFAMGIWAASEATIEENSILNCGCGIGVGKIIGTSFDSYQFGEVSLTIKENTIANNYIGIGGPIFNGKTGIGTVVATGETKAYGNFIYNNTYGLALGAMGSFHKNTITHSLTAITIYDTSAIYSPHLSDNNFEDYSQSSIYLLGPKDMYAEDNWWGTTDIQAISDSIHDKNDNPVLGAVDFEPILGSRNAEAPTEPPTPIPDLPTPSWSPTTPPDESSDATPNDDSNNYFSVESNSTITELFFNSTSSELSFTVTGPSNTTGYVRYKIAKSLLSSIQNVKVFLDGNQLDVIFTSDEDSWHLFFTYTHSSHKVIISLAKETGTIFGIDPIIWVIALVAICVPLIAVVVFWRRKQKLNGTKATQ